MAFRAAVALTKTAFFEFGVNIQNKQLKLKGRWGIQQYFDSFHMEPICNVYKWSNFEVTQSLLFFPR